MRKHCYFAEELWKIVIWNINKLKITVVLLSIVCLSYTFFRLYKNQRSSLGRPFRLQRAVNRNPDGKTQAKVHGEMTI